MNNNTYFNNSLLIIEYMETLQQNKLLLFHSIAAHFMPINMSYLRNNAA